VAGVADLGWSTPAPRRHPSRRSLWQARVPGLDARSPSVSRPTATSCTQVRLRSHANIGAMARRV